MRLTGAESFKGARGLSSLRAAVLTASAASDAAISDAGHRHNLSVGSSPSVLGSLSQTEYGNNIVCSASLSSSGREETPALASPAAISTRAQVGSLLSHRLTSTSAARPYVLGLVHRSWLRSSTYRGGCCCVAQLLLLLQGCGRRCPPASASASGEISLAEAARRQKISKKMQQRWRSSTVDLRTTLQAKMKVHVPYGLGFVASQHVLNGAIPPESHMR